MTRDLLPQNTPGAPAPSRRKKGCPGGRSATCAVAQDYDSGSNQTRAGAYSTLAHTTSEGARRAEAMKALMVSASSGAASSWRKWPPCGVVWG